MKQTSGKAAYCLLHAGVLLGLLFNPEGGSFLLNVS
jgi:hypothetical protein